MLKLRSSKSSRKEQRGMLYKTSALPGINHRVPCIPLFADGTHGAWGRDSSEHFVNDLGIITSYLLFIRFNTAYKVRMRLTQCGHQRCQGCLQTRDEISV